MRPVEKFIVKSLGLAIIVIIGIAWIGGFVKAQQGIQIENPLQYDTIHEVIEAIANALMWFGIIVVPLLVLVGALVIMTSAGDSARVSRGKKIIFYSLIGLALILLARGVIGMVNIALGLR